MEEPVKNGWRIFVTNCNVVFLPLGEYLSNEFSFDEFGALLVFFLWKNFRLRSAFTVLCLVRCLLLGEDDDWNTMKYAGDNGIKSQEVFRAFLNKDLSFWQVKWNWVFNDENWENVIYVNKHDPSNKLLGTRDFFLSSVDSISWLSKEMNTKILHLYIYTTFQRIYLGF